MTFRIRLSFSITERKLLHAKLHFVSRFMPEPRAWNLNWNFTTGIAGFRQYWRMCIFSFHHNWAGRSFYRHILPGTPISGVKRKRSTTKMEEQLNYVIPR